MTIDPNDFVDTDEAWKDEDYNPDDGITHADFTIIPGGQVDGATLVYKARGANLAGRDFGTPWAISLYQAYRYNGQDIPISHVAAEHILRNLAGTNNLEDYDWVAQDWTYFE